MQSLRYQWIVCARCPFLHRDDADCLFSAAGSLGFDGGVLWLGREPYVLSDVDATPSFLKALEEKMP